MKLFLQSLLLMSVYLTSASVAQTSESTLDMKRLWLPKSYSQYWASLRQVAEYQLAQERCTEVLRAELDRGQSSLEAPVFAVVCRNKDKKTFVERFDGLSLVSLEPEPELPVAEDEPEVADVDMRPIIYQRCQELWVSDVVQMKKLVWLDDLDSAAATELTEIDSDDNPETTTTVTQYMFIRRFNAKDTSDNDLKYQANCTGSSLSNTHTSLSIRRD